MNKNEPFFSKNDLFFVISNSMKNSIVYQKNNVNTSIGISVFKKQTDKFIPPAF